MLCFLSIEAKESSSSQVEATENVEEGIVVFTPPPNWNAADSSLLPPRVKAMVIGKSLSHFPPSINLSCEPYKGNLKQYLKMVKNMNSAQGYEWKDLGTIRTEAGNASLSQVDTQTQWGSVRFMHVISVNNGYVYLLTAAALKEEFSRFYKAFFNSMRSLKIIHDLTEMISNPQHRLQLKEATSQLENQWRTILSEKQKISPEISWKELQEKVFAGEDFQNGIWSPFKESLDQKYHELGAEWRTLFLKKLENQLFNMKP